MIKTNERKGIWTITGAFIVAGVHHGLGGHNKAVAAVSRENEVQALKVSSNYCVYLITSSDMIKYQALATALYIANMAFIKLSIAFLLLRIATRRRYIWILRISMVIVAIWSAAIFLFDMFQCSMSFCLTLISILGLTFCHSTRCISMGYPN